MNDSPAERLAKVCEVLLLVLETQGDAPPDSPAVIRLLGMSAENPEAFDLFVNKLRSAVHDYRAVVKPEPAATPRVIPVGDARLVRSDAITDMWWWTPAVNVQRLLCVKASDYVTRLPDGPEARALWAWFDGRTMKL